MLDGDTTHVNNGKIGTTGQYQKAKNHGSSAAARKFYLGQIQSKLRKGYGQPGVQYELH